MASALRVTWKNFGKIRDRGKTDNRNLAAAATTEIARGKVAGLLY